MKQERVTDKINYETHFTDVGKYAMWLKAVKDAKVLDTSAAVNEVFPNAVKGVGGTISTNKETHGVSALDRFGLIEFIDDKKFRLSSLGERWVELFENKDGKFVIKEGFEYSYVSTVIDTIYAWEDRKGERYINVGVLLFDLMLDNRLDYYITDAEFLFISEKSGIKSIDDYENLVKTILDNRAKGFEVDNLKKSDIFLSGLANSWKLLKKDDNKYSLADLTKKVLIEKKKQIEALSKSKISSSDATTIIYDFDKNVKATGGENIIFYGVPGCGKSHHVRHEYLVEKKIVSSADSEKDDSFVIRTTFYQDYTNVDFVGQVLPKVNEDKSVTYEFIPGPFTIALARAIEDPDMRYALVIEELNRGKAASIFGDIFQLLDRKDNGLSVYNITNVNIQDYLGKYLSKKFGVTYKFEHIKIPANLYIVATMNTSDQNVGVLDNAFKRRWLDQKIPNDYKTDSGTWGDWFVPGMENDKIRWYDLVYSINDFITQNHDVFVNEDKSIGVFFIDKRLLAKKESDVTEKLKKSFAYKFFEYLWNDITRLIKKDMLFANPISLDSVIEQYLGENGGKNVFRNGIIKYNPIFKASTEKK